MNDPLSGINPLSIIISNAFSKLYDVFKDEYKKSQKSVAWRNLFLQSLNETIAKIAEPKNIVADDLKNIEFVFNAALTDDNLYKNFDQYQEGFGAYLDGLLRQTRLSIYIITEADFDLFEKVLLENIKKHFPAEYHYFQQERIDQNTQRILEKIDERLELSKPVVPAPKILPMMAPPLPDHFVPRPDIYNSLLHCLLDTQSQDPVAITTALHGAGGYGKTTLAAALCHDQKVREAFSGGILWVTLGIKPDLMMALAKLYHVLTGERPVFNDIEAAAFHFAEKLATGNCLIVIDDVWDITDLKPFLRGGPNCARLFTIRNREIAAKAKRVEVDQMEPAVAVALLSGGSEAPTAAQEALVKLGQRLGRWPLLLELANHYRQVMGLGPN
jgi:hypothetical protein